MIGGGKALRVLVIAAALAAGALVSAAPASAANRFAEVGGDGGEPCEASDPCSIEVAINSASASDDVTLLGGLPPAPYETDTLLSVPANVTVHGTIGAPPMIVSDPSSANGVELHAGSVLRDVIVEFTGSNENAVELNGGGLVERVTAHATPTSGSASGACATAGAGTQFIIRDSICWRDDSSPNGGAVNARADGVVAQTLTLRNVTAVAASPNARPGLAATTSGGGTLTINATNVIAQAASGPDVGTFVNLATVSLDHSNYDSEGAGTITDPGTGTPAANQTTPPAFVNAAAGDFHQLPTSTGTIDLGTATGVSTLDFEGQARNIGAAPDIGADEIRRLTSTATACAPTSLTLGAGTTTCTATVTDTGSSPTNPTGSVNFTSNGIGTFSGGGSCPLTGNAGQPSCQVIYTPTAVGSGSHQITGSYPGDSTHESSQGSTPVAVLAPAGPSPIAGFPPPSFDLATAIKKCKKKFPKGPKRKKCIRRAKQRARS
jgi:hypothetical protein